MITYNLAVVLIATLGLVASTSSDVVRLEVRVQTRAGHELAGTLTVPRSARSGPVAVFVSGAGPHTRSYSTTASINNRAFEKIEDALLLRGVGSFRYDEVGTGASGGSYRAYATSLTLSNDLVDVLTVLGSRSGFAATEFLLIGHSEGGLVASLASTSSAKVAGLVLLAAPAVPGTIVMRDQWREFAMRNGASYDEMQVEHRDRARSDPWYRFFLTFDPAPAYLRVDRPVLILQGEQDFHVPPWHADSIASLLRHGGNRNVRINMMPDLTHGFVSIDPHSFERSVIASISTWASNLLRTRAK